MNYYNEFDPFAAAWLRELIKKGLIPDGEVDERSIIDVNGKDLKGFTQCHFFAGIGGWSYALELAGWSTDRPVWTGSPPCQPFSVAGKGKAQDDERHLWPHFFSLSGVIHDGSQCSTLANTIDTGQSPSAGRGSSSKSSKKGNDSRGSCENGSLGNAECDGLNGSKIRRGSSESKAKGWMQQHQGSSAIQCRDGKWREIPTEPEIFPLAYGIPNRVGLLRGAGNAIVPQVAAEMIKAYMEY